MKNIYIYYIALLVPMAILIYLMRTDPYSSITISLFFFYLLVYRTYIDGKRLAEKGIIRNKDIWKMIIPGMRTKHARELYFRK
ncbi:MAG: hypothetical protein HRT66_10770 [Flavobacteriaceae bacterium]|nr:hypothetical protein [Flavobacteriaceae bacterium]